VSSGAVIGDLKEKLSTIMDAAHYSALREVEEQSR